MKFLFKLLIGLYLTSSLQAVAMTQSIQGEENSVQEAEEPWIQADRQFRASYFYVRYLAAGMRGDFLEAAQNLKAAVDADPQSVALQSELADHLEVLGDPAAAAGALKAAAAADPQDYDLCSRLAHLLIRAGDLEGAKLQYLEYLKNNPGHRGAMHGMAAIAGASGDFPQAVILLEQILKAYPQSVSDLELYAEMLGRIKDVDKKLQFSKAEKAWLQLLELKPQHGNGWFRLALLYEDQGSPMQAEQTFLKGLEVQPGQYLLLDGLARFYYREERFEDAQRAFQVSHQANPADAETLLYLALSRLHLKKYEMAEADFLKAAEIQQEASASQLYGLGLALAGQKKMNQAEPVFKTLIDTFPEAISGYIQLALLYDQLDDPLKTISILEQGLGKNPRQDELYLMLGAAHTDQKNFIDAERVLVEGISKSAKTESLSFQLAALFDKTDRFDLAEKTLRELIKNNPENAQALNYLGYSLAEKGRLLPEAQNLIERALKVDPGNYYYMDSLGWVLYQQGLYKEALGQLEKSAAGLEGKWTHEDAVILEHLGDTLLQLGKKSEARKHYKAAAKLRPEDARILRKAGILGAAAASQIPESSTKD